jgi:hypothetical protein
MGLGGGAVFMILLLLVSLEALLWRQFSWMKASLLFVFHFSVLFQLIVGFSSVGSFA